MNKAEKLMIFGGGKLQASLIKTANKLGYYSILVDPDPNAIGKNIADEFIVLEGNDYEKTLDIAKTNKVKGLVTTATDKPLYIMARVAENLNLPFPSKEAIYNTTNKFLLKKNLSENNIPCANGFLTNLNEIEDNMKISGIRFPVIIKPLDSSGSRGVFYCKDKEDLFKVYSESIKYSNFDKVLIEEYLEGPEISVEALVQDNNLYIIQITDKIVTPFPYNVEMGHFQPSIFFTEYFDEIFQILNNAVKVLGLNNCALHPEMKITKDGIKIVEIGPRLGGDYINSHLTPLSTGINIEEQLIKIAVGEKININRNTTKYSAILYFDFLSNPSNFINVREKIKVFEKNILDFEIYYDDYSNLPVITNSLERHGHVIFSANSLQELFYIKEQLI